MLKKSEDGVQRVLSLSYGKDSIATIRACELLGYPLDRIVTADVWATDTIPAEQPEMVAFKNKADGIILDRYGIAVEHVCARNKDGTKKTYEQMFYTEYQEKNCRSKKFGGGYGYLASTVSHTSPPDGVTTSKTKHSKMHGFPHTIGGWCHRLKVDNAIDHLFVTSAAHEAQT